LTISGLAVSGLKKKISGLSISGLEQKLAMPTSGYHNNNGSQSTVGKPLNLREVYTT
jgi:hypothetical protein